MNLVGKDDIALRTICSEIPFGEDVNDIANEMLNIMNVEKGVGLAAPQIGVTRRLITVNYAATCMAIVNPVITKSPGKIVKSLNEECLSFPGKRVNIKRSKRVIVEGFDIKWSPIKIDARNMLAFIFQHEIDHLNGITII